MGTAGGRYGFALAALVLLNPCALAEQAVLAVVNSDEARVLEFPLRPGDSWCLLWNHSVTGFTVTDCFVYHPPAMVLDRSHQPDFAAGLGHFGGRGQVRSDGSGGYWIEDIDEVVEDNRLYLRVGPASVDHRVAFKGSVTSLSRLLPGQRVTIRLVMDR